MTIEQVMAMIRRRGYVVYRYPPSPEADTLRSSYELILIRHDHLLLEWAISRLDLANLKIGTALWRNLVEQRLAPLAGGLRHMQCSLCQTPVLRGAEKRAFALAELEALRAARYGNTLLIREWTPSGPREMRWRIERESPSHWFCTCFDRVVYRDASRGAESEPITHCLRCHTSIKDCAREIEDGDNV